MHRILRLLKKRIVLLDGATGTNLLDKGLAPGESPSVLNVRDPGAVERVQQAYVDAGSDIILTNTFSANPVNIPAAQLPRVLRAGVRIARKAAGRQTYVLGDIGPLGELIRPFGEADYEEAFTMFKMIARILSSAGIEAFFIETFTSMIEAKAAFLAAREFSSDIFVSFSLQDNGYTIMGERPETLALTFEALGAKGVGINCTPPDVALEALDRMSRVTSLRLIAKPNAGSVQISGTTIQHSLTDADLARYYARFVKAGANMIGGCCGSTPDYIGLLRRKHKRPKTGKVGSSFALVSPGHVLTLEDKEFLVVGERLNPSGRKRVKECLLKGDYSIYADEAQQQEQARADILDVNAFIIEKNETETLSHAVMEVIKSSKLPILVDTQDFEAAERVLRFYPGIGVLNSIPARSRELRRWLPMIKHYGFKAVISLIGNKIPRTVGERMKYAVYALDIARKVGFPREDMIFDPLVFSAATDSDQAAVTLETVRLLRKRGLKTILGISNVSYGLPTRSRLNVAFMSAAIAHGVSFVIVNPMSNEVQNAISSCKALYHGMVTEYIARLRASDTSVSRGQAGDRQKSKDSLIAAIVQGDPGMSVAHVRTMLGSHVAPQDIIDEHIAPALKQIGDQYESGSAFIPDLLRAAEASQHVLNMLKQYLPKHANKGTIILATVKGDIHDIGKNIAAMIFESAGYRVIDLGKDVGVTQIVQAIKKYRPDAVGLSALLTTTMPQMSRVVEYLREHNISTKVIVGGPNVSDAFAKSIGAFGAARTVLEGLQILRRSM